MSNVTVKELRVLAKEVTIKGYSRMKKADLESVIREPLVSRLLNVVTNLNKGEDNMKTVNDDVIDNNVTTVGCDIPTPINAINVIIEESDDVIAAGAIAAAIEAKAVKTEEAKVTLKYKVGDYVLQLSNKVCFVVSKIEDNGLYKLLNCKNRPIRVTQDILFSDSRFVSISKEEAYKMVKEMNTVHPSAVNKIEEIEEKVNKAGQYAKSNFKYRVEQTNNFRKAYIIDNKTNKNLGQIGVGKTIVREVLNYEMSNGNKVTVTRTKNNSKKYNPNVKHTNILCTECLKQGKQHYISEAELRYLKDSQQYLPNEYKRKGICYKHQATTGVRKAIILGRRNSNTNK